MDKKRILFILHLPPPVHGAAVMGSILRDSPLVNRQFDCRFLNLSASSTLFEVGRGSGRKIRFILHLLREIRHTVRQWKPDAVYVTPTSKLPPFAKDYLIVQYLKRLGCRVILHYHNKGIRERQDRWLDNLLYTRFFRETEVILLSERLYPDIEKYVPRTRVHICPNGLPPVMAPSTPGQEGTPVLLFFSNLLKSKGIHVYLEACRLLQERGCTFRCLLGGAPTAEMSWSDLERLVQEKGLTGRSVCRGPVYGEEKARLFSEADIFVFPTQDEAFGLVALEAMMASLPVVASRTGAVPDLVDDGKNGFLVEPGDAAALADALQRLISDRELRLRFGKNGLERYRQQFTSDCFERRMVEILSAF